MNFFSPIIMNQNELRSAVIQNIGAAPTNPAPKTGQLYYDTTANAVEWYNGTIWINPLSRANHFGTQLAATISNFTAAATAISLDQFTPPAANLNANSFRITSVADPVNPQDAATKNYVDVSLQAAAAGISSKPPVQAASTSNIATLSGLPTVDGIALAAGQRVLLTAQTTASQNGPWVVAGGAWTRPSGDSSPNAELTLGALWYVEQGTNFGGSQFILNSPTSGTITPGTTAVTIVQFQGASNLTFSNGVVKSGNSVTAQVVAGGGILASASGLQVDTTVVARKFAQSIGDGSSTSITVTHNLGTVDVEVQVRDASGNQIIVDNAAATINTVTFTFTTAPTSNQYRAIIIG